MGLSLCLCLSVTSRSSNKTAKRRITQTHEAPLSMSDRAMRLVSSNLANCHATVHKLLILQVLTELIV